MLLMGTGDGEKGSELAWRCCYLDGDDNVVPEVFVPTILLPDLQMVWTLWPFPSAVA